MGHDCRRCMFHVPCRRCSGRPRRGRFLGDDDDDIHDGCPSFRAIDVRHRDDDDVVDAALLCIRDDDPHLRSRPWAHRPGRSADVLFIDYVPMFSTDVGGRWANNQASIHVILTSHSHPGALSPSSRRRHSWAVQVSRKRNNKRLLRSLQMVKHQCKGDCTGLCVYLQLQG